MEFGKRMKQSVELSQRFECSSVRSWKSSSMRGLVSKIRSRKSGYVADQTNRDHVRSPGFIFLT